MSSPFPGMDPYLESRWRDVHTRIMVYAVDAISDLLPEGLVAWVEEGVSVDVGDYVRAIAPDINIADKSGNRSRNGGVATASPLVAAEPIIVPVSEPLTQRHIEIVDQTTGQKVVTAIEFLSPTNKIPREGREHYQRKQREYLDGGVNLVEVDLVRSGRFTLAVPKARLPQSEAATYYISVRRASHPTDAEVYPAPLRERLPTIRIPLRPGDADVPLDVQALIDTCYDHGHYAAKLDYTTRVDPPLSAADAAWAEELLTATGLR
jgi:hypothetical protein